MVNFNPNITMSLWSLYKLDSMVYIFKNNIIFFLWVNAWSHLIDVTTHFQLTNKVLIRASVAGVPNAKFGIWPTKHQKQSIMRCFKSQKICHTTTVLSQIWDGMDNNCKNKYYYFITFFSLLFHKYLSLRLLSLSLSNSISFLLSLSLSILSLSSLLKKVAQDHSPVLAVDLSSPRHWSRQSLLLISPPRSPQLAADLAASFSNPRHQHPQPSPPTFKSLLIELWVWDLGWVSTWILSWHFGSALCGLWVEVLGRLG